MDLLSIDQYLQQPEIAKYTADGRVKLDETAYEAAWAEGQNMTLERAVAYALSDE